jgi:hypothetical protein
LIPSVGDHARTCGNMGVVEGLRFRHHSFD